MDFVSPNADRPISEQAFRHAAADLGCDVAAVKAVAEIESRRAPFQSDGRPTILFERHIFRRRTDRRFCAAHPDLSGPRGGYGKFSAQYDKLFAAMALHEEAALESTSWGAFQIMGFNHALCGFDAVKPFVEAMVNSADRHLAAFVSFVLHHGLDGALRRHDWARFARGYNGPAFRDNAYDAKMAAAYARFSEAEPTPDADATVSPIDSIAGLQRALAHLGLDPGPVDNRMGPQTRAAIVRFQRFAHLPADGAASAPTRAAVQAAYHMMRSFESLDAA